MKIIFKIIAFIAALIVSGCMMTEEVLKIGEKDAIKDKIYAFLSYPDNSKIVIVGEKYHYFLNPDENLLRFLQMQNKPPLSVSLSNFKMNGKEISGIYNIFINKEKLDRSVTLSLVEAGFKEGPHGFFMLGKVSGNLRISSQLAIESVTNFKNSYELEIEQSPSTAVTLTKLAISPLTIVADVGIVVAGTGIFLAAIPVVCISKGIIDIARGNEMDSKCPSGF